MNARNYTHYFIVDINVDNLSENQAVKDAAALLRKNETVAFPTETVYGLGGNALSGEAIARIFKAKGRPADNPLIAHVADKEDIYRYTEDVNEKAEQLIDAFWPGPLTLIFPHNGSLSEAVTAGLPTVAIRMPGHPLALALIRKAGVPVAAPSANTSGRPSPTSAAHVRVDLDGKIAAVVDGGATGVGLESTVVDCSGDIPVILRPGGITKEQLEEVIGPVEVDPALAAETAAPRSPGMKYTHYAPNAALTVVEGSDRFFQEQIDEAARSGRRVGILVPEEKAGRYTGAAEQVVCGSSHDLRTVARDLYAGLRAFDLSGRSDVIFAAAVPETDIGQAVMNRLRKAAGNRIVSEK
ncbi:threonylcarbamoyl-AMP synthase [Alteribacter lacisalsi]|uniref:Threonylcarbamoyl-AMP synthase n=1 Tax=Alteribacter lacisalsi TaxID=2045244 RepID=A0A2W0H604_9BACI|nr:L-threonylcarbamoyladenylate synthase [Alteribacter lacisalsi]PYZ96096.1 threonylcarbamoyl-AMP synthase [Alteribacter lacisalsi]